MRIKHFTSVTALWILLLLPFQMKPQASGNIAIGSSGIYNLKNYGVGHGMRLILYPQFRLNIVGEFSYFLPLFVTKIPLVNSFPLTYKVHEYYAGVSVNYKIHMNHRINQYLIGNAAFNYWPNFRSSSKSNAKKHGTSFEAGYGIAGNRCFRPFIEARYNIIKLEPNVRFGFAWIFNCVYFEGYGGDARKRYKCPSCF